MANVSPCGAGEALGSTNSAYPCLFSWIRSEPSRPDPFVVLHFAVHYSRALYNPRIRDPMRRMIVARSSLTNLRRRSREHPMHFSITYSPLTTCRLTSQSAATSRPSRSRCPLTRPLPPTRHLVPFLHVAAVRRGTQQACQGRRSVR